VLLGAGEARAGVRDPFFPGLGDRGFDVVHYGVGLAYSPASGELRASARIAATARTRLDRFSLDLDGLRVTEVSVDGKRARFSHRAKKLVVAPATRLGEGERFLIVIRYRGRPRPVTDPDGTLEGWIRTDDGALAIGEPVGTAAWLPCNDVPADKASFDFRLTVPGRLTGVANGRLIAVHRRDGRATFVWRETQPMAPYLAVVDIGRSHLERSEVAGRPAWLAVDSGLKSAGRSVLDRFAEIVGFESRAFGPYPFEALGSIVDPAPLEYAALETQTRPIYFSRADRTTVVHEMAHQWFGDSVGLTGWPEIWLNEGFATWAEWYYAERHGGRSAHQVFMRLYRTPATATDFWSPPPGHPGTVEHLFAPSIYERGGMALQALREEIGMGTFLTLLRRWTAEHRHANATIPQFIDLAEEVSGRDLDKLFDDWLYLRGKPPGYG
jgi:aminopeptidase N